VTHGQGLGGAAERVIRKRVVTSDGMLAKSAGEQRAALAEETQSGAASGADVAGAVQVLIRVTPGHEYVKAVLHRGRVVGAMLIGDTDLEETFENLILNGIDVSSLADDLLDPEVDLEDFFD
jgi:hypothetical protein